MRGWATMIRAIIFDLDNTLTDFMKMKRAAIDAAVDGMLDAGLTLPREEVATRIYQVYDREGIEYQQVFDRFLNEARAPPAPPILRHHRGLRGYRGAKAEPQAVRARHRRARDRPERGDHGRRLARARRRGRGQGRHQDRVRPLRRHLRHGPLRRRLRLERRLRACGDRRPAERKRLGRARPQWSPWASTSSKWVASRQRSTAGARASSIASLRGAKSPTAAARSVKPSRSPSASPPRKRSPRRLRSARSRSGAR